MNALATNLETQAEDQTAIEVVAQAENDANYLNEPEISVWTFDPSICG
ncbi:hypothetical protein [Thiothrix eikelboomii]|uniref:Uncharacterized protein n=1 Tax=Thiothrix eikelboomii TaxID=92487 RepID=A0A1T4VU06_9GAMM|nr:hypothetical protein [Thiothrix eikelboomii]SKA68399.1 hypothetical protein SAMN02745130_00284 [Thiothrix eikelboomii]